MSVTNRLFGAAFAVTLTLSMVPLAAFVVTWVGVNYAADLLTGRRT